MRKAARWEIDRKEKIMKFDGELHQFFSPFNFLLLAAAFWGAKYSLDDVLLPEPEAFI